MMAIFMAVVLVLLQPMLNDDVGDDDGCRIGDEVLGGNDV